MFVLLPNDVKAAAEKKAQEEAEVRAKVEAQRAKKKSEAAARSTQGKAEPVLEKKTPRLFRAHLEKMGFGGWEGVCRSVFNDNSKSGRGHKLRTNILIQNSLVDQTVHFLEK